MLLKFKKKIPEIHELKPKSLENSRSAFVCCSDELRDWVSNNSPNSESCTSTSPLHLLELTGNFLVTVENPMNPFPEVPEVPEVPGLGSFLSLSPKLDSPLLLSELTIYLRKVITNTEN